MMAGEFGYQLVWVGMVGRTRSENPMAPRSLRSICLSDTPTFECIVEYHKYSNLGSGQSELQSKTS